MSLPLLDSHSRELDLQPRVSPANTLQIRLAQNPSDVAAAQALRYEVFYEELSARPSPTMMKTRRDFDRFDIAADHLLVVDTAYGEETIVGTYRLLRRQRADDADGFYSSSEFDISRLVNSPGEILELGRSCVAAPYRTRYVMQLLWRGIAAYMFDHNIKIMFGCASFPGTDPAGLEMELSYLHHFHLAPAQYRVRALPSRYENMDRMPRDRFDPRVALARIPALLKGYLRVGGYVGDGAVVDSQFNTTDVCVIVPCENIAEKYMAHYQRKFRR